MDECNAEKLLFVSDFLLILVLTNTFNLIYIKIGTRMLHGIVVPIVVRYDYRYYARVIFAPKAFNR